MVTHSKMTYQQSDISIAKDQPVRKVSYRRWIIGMVLLVPLVIIWTTFMRGDLRSFKVISLSMYPTLDVGDYVVMQRQGDFVDLRHKVIAFRAISSPTEILTKRVLAADNDVVSLRRGKLFVNNVPEAAVLDVQIEAMVDHDWKVPADHVFVVGDNRNNSYDSLDYGPVPRAQILGVLTFRYWPLRRMGSLF